MLKYYGYAILGNVGVVGNANLYLKEEELQENQFKNLTYVHDTCREQRPEKYKEKGL